MKNDHQIDITIDNTKQFILEQLIDNHDMYGKFQAFDSWNEGDRCTDSNVLIEDILDFYSGKNYMKNVVNWIVKLASDALGINIYIYENSDGQIPRVRNMGGLACKDVFVKFTHNPIHNLGNHYNAILMKPDFHNLDLLLNTAVSEIIQPPSSNKPLHLHMFIPKYIDGFKKYLVQTNNYVEDMRDLRYFTMSTSSKTSYKGVRKVCTCHGSWECQNPYCGFIDTSVDNQPNIVDWLTVKGKKDVKICSVCRHIAKRQGCGAHKLIDYNPKTKIAIVFHMGTHKC